MVDEPTLDRLVAGDGRVGPFVVSHEGRFLKSFVRPLLCGDSSRVGPGREWEPPLSVPGEVDRRLLVELLGEHRLASRDGLDAPHHLVARELQRRWTRLHPAGAVRSLGDALVGRLLRRTFNAGACLVVRATPSQRVQEATRSLVAEARRLFIEVRPALMPGSRLVRMGAELTVWRPPPVSEFVVTVVVDEQPPGVPSRRRAPARRRWPPTAHLDLPEQLTAGEAAREVRAHVLRLLAETYPSDDFIADRVETGRRSRTPARIVLPRGGR
jgi:hypothetical protein